MNSVPLLLLMSFLSQSAADSSTPAVRFELFHPEPVAFKLFALTPVTFDIFSASPVVKKPIVFDPEHEQDKALVPPPFGLPPEQPPAAPVLPVVRVYTSVGCDRCEVAKRDYAMALRRGALLPFHLRFESNAPDWVDTFPTLHFRGTDGWKKVEGWSGLEEFTRRFRAATARKQPARRAELRLAIPQPAARWTYPGRIQDHLREHGWTGSLEGLSVEEMERIHSALHEGLMQPDAAPRQESRVHRPRRRSSSSRQFVSSESRQFDPFLLVSILGLVWNVGTFLCGSCGP